MTDSQRHYAHSLPPPHAIKDWETLEKHLADVADLAGEFCDAFGAKEWGIALGRWHDLGKYSERFQQYLLATADPDAAEDEQLPGRVDHSTFGARHAAEVVGGHAGQLLAFIIAGHHGTLANGLPTDATDERSSLKHRLDPERYVIPPVALPAQVFRPSKLSLPFTPSQRNFGFQIAFFARMLFSAIVDADRLATEAFCDQPQSRQRGQPKSSTADLHASLNQHLRLKRAEASPTPVNGIRASVLTDCVVAASLPPGFFSLNVPTGGGKTLSSLAFALRHAVTHGLRRAVVAIPFTSIIEQNADVYRGALGSLAANGLIEHHSNIDPKKDTRQNKLASENWDAGDCYDQCTTL
jgi:CRISPR-associated endonuclease/helicase Cas3